jgi:hypothetical protein
LFYARWATSCRPSIRTATRARVITTPTKPGRRDQRRQRIARVRRRCSRRTHQHDAVHDPPA